MAVRSSLQKFLALFKELKAAAGNDPSVLSEFDKAPDELRAATRLNSFAKTLEEEIIYGPEKMIAHAPPEWASAWAEYKRSWEPRLDHFLMCEFDPGGCPAFLLNIEKRSLPRLMLSGDGLASKDAV